MGKFKGKWNNNNQGGNQHGGGGRGNGGNGGKWCKHCKRDNHNTNECKKAPQHGGPQNQNNRIDKHKNKNKNGNNQNNNGNNNNHQHQQKRRDPCTRCGFPGHEYKNCHAKEVPEEERCECQCDFHRSHQCPWNNDYLERESAVQQATGKICQWCKDAGDGTHVYEECKEPKKFRNQLLSTIMRAYDDIKWCWHCSSVNHATRGCSATSADEGKIKWNAKISDLISEWRSYDTSSYEARYRDDDEDIAMTTARNQQKPPVAADFKWCILCEEFGHYADANATDCRRGEYEKRCPPQFKSQVVVARQPFVPAGFNAAANGRAASNNAAGAFGATTTFYHKCVFDDCRAKLGPWYIPCPPKGQSIICRNCHRANAHPSGPARRDSKVELLDMVLKFISSNGNGGSASALTKKSRKQKILDAIKNPYLKRPSILLSKRLALYEWPQSQPQYTDMAASKDKSPIFHPMHEFNMPGNHQAYFPAVKFHISEAMMEHAKNDEYNINKAGRMGLVLKCLKCDMPAKVLDDEGDLVMCGTDPMCTVGMGTGYAYWADEKGVPRGSCRCLKILGQSSEPGWVAPKVGR
ncbi:hypothetical protein BU26DRAFT_294236 [Trematosphaeria pertusa]|uniref:CCHC-type domain-containing protein n=1 Tax=Trematosphaeria pertusa TaxID=390896 RepID=A0A6A6IKD1_9PLEO|nr:uncharacterized protein BU26DRAFT_294236 [Trematosphaeria pertusa]KAF2250020.1 hypothetical protein BU26DRAFT_294236 [Trematosphaeria pertusa]